MIDLNKIVTKEGIGEGGNWKVYRCLLQDCSSVIVKESKGFVDMAIKGSIKKYQLIKALDIPTTSFLEVSSLDGKSVLVTEDLNSNYSNGIGTDPVGGVEAVLSHFISKELQVPCAHSPAFEDYRIYPELVNARAASEYITPTFLPCILLGLSNAPLLSVENGISVECLDYLIMPYNSLGSVPVFAIKENNTVLNVCPEKISEKIIEMPDYSTCYDYIVNNL